MANDVDMTGWSELLHTSTKLLEQASSSTHFTPLQRSLDQLETLSTKLKAKTLRAEAPSQSISATRLLAREGINAEQLARDLKSFELKTTFEDVFPSEAATLEEYLQQKELEREKGIELDEFSQELHEMAIVSSIQEAQKDNLRSFNDHMMRVLEDDWNKEKRDFLQSLSRLSTLPRRSSSVGGAGFSRPALMSPQVSTSQLSSGPSAMAIVPASDKTVTEKKASVYAEIVRDLNEARSRRLPFKLAMALRAAYEGLGADSSGGKSVNLQKIWHLIQALVGEDMTTPRSTSRRVSLVIGARRHLEWGHEKYIMDTIQSHATVATLGGSVGNIQKIQAFLRVRLRDHGVLDFDATDMRRQPPVDTTWQQIYYCLRTGYYDEAKKVAQSSRAAHQFAPQLTEWIVTGGNVSSETAISASEECEKMLRLTDRAGRPSYDRKKLILYAIVSGSRRHIERMLRDLPNLFTTIEDFLWFKMSAVRDPPSSASSSLFSTEGLVPYTLEDLQSYLNKFEPAYYTKNGRDPLVYPYVLLLSLQFLPAILYLSKEGEEGVSIDAVHIAICLADRGVLEGSGSGQKAGVMDACAEVAGVIRQYGSVCLRNGNLELALEYYVQAASAIGGGEASWIGNSTVEQQRQRNIVLRQLLTEILLIEGGIDLLLGLRGTGEEGELSKYMTDLRTRLQFLVEAARHCQESGLYDKSMEIHKRVGAFGMALETINKCLSDAICAMARGRLDSNSQATSLVRSSDDVLEASRNYPQASEQDKELLIEQQTVLRQLETILSILTLARAGHHVEALREIINIKFLPLDPRSSNISSDVVRNLNPHVQACVPDLLRVALTCLDSVGDADGTLRALKSKIASIVANNMSMNWPQDLYEKVARSI